jgi:hypothetical protein
MAKSKVLMDSGMEAAAGSEVVPGGVEQPE